MLRLAFVVAIILSVVVGLQTAERYTVARGKATETQPCTFNIGGVLLVFHPENITCLRMRELHGSLRVSVEPE